MIKIKSEIINKWNEYKTNIGYSLEKLNNLLDKELITKYEYKKNGTSLLLLFNSYGAYMASWQDDNIEFIGIKSK